MALSQSVQAMKTSSVPINISYEDLLAFNETTVCTIEDASKNSVTFRYRNATNTVGLAQFLDAVVQKGIYISNPSKLKPYLASGSTSGASAFVKAANHNVSSGKGSFESKLYSDLKAIFPDKLIKSSQPRGSECDFDITTKIPCNNGMIKKFIVRIQAKHTPTTEAYAIYERVQMVTSDNCNIQEGSTNFVCVGQVNNYNQLLSGLQQKYR